MIRHALKLVWNRRRANALLGVELLISFLVLVAILTVSMHFLDNWRRPLGFRYDDVWLLEARRGDYYMASDTEREAMREASRRLLGALDALEGVRAVSPLSYNVPFRRGSSSMTTHIDGREVDLQISDVSPALRDVMGFQLEAGRWLEPGDEQLGWQPVVVTRRVALDLLGRPDPIGETLVMYEANGEPEEREAGEPEQRVVGVISAYRRYGELHTEPYGAFVPIAFGTDDRAPRSFVVRVDDGATAAFEEELVATAHAVVPDWSFRVTPLPALRRGMLRDDLLPLLVASTVAGFMILMVGMGLVGVLWQNVTRRTREIGIRRALGAKRRHIVTQRLMPAMLPSTMLKMRLVSSARIRSSSGTTTS
jgi:putative ABC transport system permease protein